jgi:hypothetical protein
MVFGIGSGLFFAFAGSIRTAPYLGSLYIAPFAASTQTGFSQW